MNIVSAIQILFGVIVALITVWIAIQQLKIQETLKQLQQHRFNLDLFEKRMKIYSVAYDAVLKVVQYKSISNEDEIAVNSVCEESQFLFGNEVVEYLEELGEKFHLAHVNRSALVAYTKNESNKETDVIKEFQREYEELRRWFETQTPIKDTTGNLRRPFIEKFLKYMHLGVVKNK